MSGVGGREKVLAPVIRTPLSCTVPLTLCRRSEALSAKILYPNTLHLLYLSPYNLAHAL